jgi:hypothetical protein
MSYGFVYLIVNREMPDVFKIGFTERSPHLRAEELSKSTSVPYQFDVLCYIEVEECQAVEVALHRFFRNWRVRPDREFFYWHHGDDAPVLAVGAFWHWPRRLAFTIVPEVAYEVFGQIPLDRWRDPKVYGDPIPSDCEERLEIGKRVANAVPLKAGGAGIGGDDEPF